MGEIPYRRFDPLLPDEQVDAMLRLCERFGRDTELGVTIVDDYIQYPPPAPEPPTS